MPDVGYYEKRPRKEHRDFLVNALKGKYVVSDVEELDDFHYVVTKRSMSTIYIYLTNKYILSVTDVMEILQSSPKTTCIVSTMDYNQYTPDAKRYCRDRGVGLFKTVELLGAVFHDGADFLDYVQTRRR